MGSLRLTLFFHLIYLYTDVRIFIAKNLVVIIMELKGNKINLKDNIFNILMLCFISLNGLFNEYLSILSGVVLGAFIIIKYREKGELTFKINLTSVAIFTIVLFYGLSAFWAVDRGSAVLGFAKFLPVLLFLILLFGNSRYKSFLNILPAFAVIMTLVSSLLMQLDAFEEYFSVAGRLSGFFQYSNTFALFLLVALIILATKSETNKYEYIYFPIIIFGILYSGSRTVFVLTLLTVAGFVFLIKNRRIKYIILILFSISVLAVIAVISFTDKSSVFGRFLTISLSRSTFVGRFLYFYDALPVILKNPFGTGYLGHYFMQQSIQTGVYSVRFIHNDFLQLLLDIGWIPTALFIAAIIKSFFKKGTSLRNRLILFMISAHACFDFDLQFIAVFMIFIACFDTDSGKEIKINYKKFALPSLCVFSVFMFYMFLSQALLAFGDSESSYKLYPFSGETKIKMLTKTEDIAEVNRIADEILESNEYASVAYSAKSRYYYSLGDFENMIRYKDLAIKYAPLSSEEYEDYLYMLLVGVQLYSNAGDTESADYCKNKIVTVYNDFLNMRNRLSALGKKIKDQPDFELSKEINEYITETVLKNED